MPRSVKCRVCGAKSPYAMFEKRMEWLRHHYKHNHPKLWREAKMKRVETIAEKYAEPKFDNPVDSDETELDINLGLMKYVYMYITGQETEERKEFKEETHKKVYEMGRHRLTKDEMRRGTLKALKNPKTPPHFRKAMERRAEKEGWI
jgi:hypothetical protein